jgi:hypothetical protein
MLPIICILTTFCPSRETKIFVLNHITIEQYRYTEVSMFHIYPLPFEYSILRKIFFIFPLSRCYKLFAIHNFRLYSYLFHTYVTLSLSIYPVSFLFFLTIFPFFFLLFQFSARSIRRPGAFSIPMLKNKQKLSEKPT